ncbi:hypothetical protein CO178_02385 [candidate division WWE3 bacterium CG_4_9_14_3_um_filter_34_6]|uniref:PIN domain-containing protein n=1 Tax=candidate division WWE3 bacterium CG_4_9_14_3_um_filter_34_6 TaxID=1975079 RepID=A0A2M7X2A3_UNCKA|nr:MAG: hypothetical protein CO178_02385 [candidate division WWE3 bacterium CG_4_9_14_3_um_filter_34_6]
MKMSINPANKALVDTNIIIRALIDRNDVFNDIVETYSEVHIPLSIFFETVFVLEKIYKQARPIIVDYISTIISYENILAEKEILKEILEIYLDRAGLSIIDCFLLAYSNTHKLELKTFDKDLAKQ